MTPPLMRKVLACPFCGSPSTPAYGYGEGVVVGVQCSNDGCVMSCAYMTEEQWNRRAVDEAGVDRVTSLLIDWDRWCIDPFDVRARKLIQAYLGKERGA